MRAEHEPTADVDMRFFQSSMTVKPCQEVGPCPTCPAVGATPRASGASDGAALLALLRKSGGPEQDDVLAEFEEALNGMVAEDNSGDDGEPEQPLSRFVTPSPDYMHPSVTTRPDLFDLDAYLTTCSLTSMRA